MLRYHRVTGSGEAFKVFYGLISDDDEQVGRVLGDSSKLATPEDCSDRKLCEGEYSVGDCLFLALSVR